MRDTWDVPQDIYLSQWTIKIIKTQILIMPQKEQINETYQDIYKKFGRSHIVQFKILQFLIIVPI